MQTDLCTYQVSGLTYFVESKLYDINMPQKQMKNIGKTIWGDFNVIAENMVNI